MHQEVLLLVEQTPASVSHFVQLRRWGGTSKQPKAILIRANRKFTLR